MTKGDLIGQLTNFVDALVSTDIGGRAASQFIDQIANSAIPPTESLRIYQRNVFGSRKKVLQSTFEITRKILGKKAFDKAAEHFIVNSIHSAPANLILLGDGFWVELPRTIVYLRDLAKLEWAYHKAFFSEMPESPRKFELADLASSSDIHIGIPASATLIKSAYNILSVWKSYQPEAELIEESKVDDDIKNPNYLIVWRRGLTQCIHRVDPMLWEVLSLSTSGMPLVASIESVHQCWDQSVSPEHLTQQLATGLYQGWIADNLMGRSPNNSLMKSSTLPGQQCLAT